MAQPTGRGIVLGFLTVRETPDGGARGGYLLTTEYGRPIEFHYTSELRIAGPQRVLYGETALEYLHLDALAIPLTERQTAAPHAVLVDRPGLLELRRRIPAPALLVDGAEIRAHAAFPRDLEALARLREHVPVGFDWREPFARLTQALAEIREPRALAA